MNTTVAVVSGACAYLGVDDYVRMLGARLKQAREAAGLSQQKAASETGIDTGTLSKYELGKVEEPSMPKVRKLAALYGVRVEWLDTGAEPRSLAPATRVDRDDTFPELLAYAAEMERAGTPVAAEHLETMKSWRLATGPADREIIVGWHRGLAARDARRALERPMIDVQIDTGRGQRPLPPTKRKR